MSDYELHLGDCLSVMKEIKSGSVDAVITDPPYGLNTKSARSGVHKINPWADLVNSAYWYTALLNEFKRIVRQDSAAIWMFLNWRSLVTFQKAVLDAHLSITSLLVWDKEWIGPGGPYGLRPSYELVMLICLGDFALPNRGLPDIWRSKWSSKKPNGHPAEKPENLMLKLVKETPAATILDPFMGSGTTGVACAQLGRKFIGIELDPDYYTIAEKRIKIAYSQQVMF